MYEVKKANAKESSRLPGSLDIQAAHDVIAKMCISTFNQNGDIPSLVVSIGTGANDGSIELIGRIEMESFGSLILQGERGPKMTDAAYDVLTNESMRQAIRNSGSRPADIIGFVTRVRRQQPGHEPEESLFISIHTQNYSFRSHFPVVSDGLYSQKAYYAPIQQADLTELIEKHNDTNKEEFSSDVKYENDIQSSSANGMLAQELNSSMPALCISHRIHDIHSSCGSLFH